MEEARTTMNRTIPPAGTFLDNEHPHNFSKLAREFLDAAKFTHAGFQGVPMWPTYYLAFQSIENSLKAHLLAHGATIQHVKSKIRHQIDKALKEAKSNGLSVPMPAEVEKAVLETSICYIAHDFRYRSIGEWNLVLPNDLIAYAEELCNVTSY